jgi:fatty acid CoA ligase FadD32
MTDVRAAARPAAPALTLVSQTRRLAETIGDRPGYTFVDYLSGPQGRRASLTWRETDLRARALAAALRRRVIAGERAAVLAPQGLDYVVAMLGAFYARVVAIPLFTPDLPGHRERLAHILADADPACVLTTESAAASVEVLLREGPARPRDTLIVDTVPAGLADGWQDEDAGPADLAYLQYTSGSTRAPAGVMITHGCLAANAAQISAALEIEQYRSTAVGWLPLFHDMGFVMTVAMPIATGGQAAFMDPVAFLMQPASTAAPVTAGEIQPRPGPSMSANAAAPSMAVPLSRPGASMRSARRRSDSSRASQPSSRPARPSGTFTRKIQCQPRC